MVTNIQFTLTTFVLFEDEGAIGLTGTKGSEATKLFQLFFLLFVNTFKRKVHHFLNSQHLQMTNQEFVYTKMLKKFAPEDYKVDIKQVAGETKYEMVKKK